MSTVGALQEMLKEDIARFDRESTRHKGMFRRTQTAVIALTASTAIVAGLGLILPGLDSAIHFAVLCLAAVTTAVTSWAEMRRARELWQHERMVFYALKDLAREVDFYASVRALTPENLEGYFQRAAGILGTSTQQWSKIQEMKRETPPPRVAPAGGGG